MKQRLLILNLIIAFIISQLLLGQNPPVEKKDTSKVENTVKVKEGEKACCKHEKGKTCPKCEAKGKENCCKDKKCCEKCAGKKCDDKCCAKCAEKCTKELKKTCAKDSTAKCEKHMKENIDKEPGKQKEEKKN